MCDLPDRREIVGGPGVFAIVAGGLAADVGGVGDEDAGKEKSSTESQRHREMKEESGRGKSGGETIRGAKVAGAGQSRGGPGSPRFDGSVPDACSERGDYF